MCKPFFKALSAMLQHALCGGGVSGGIAGLWMLLVWFLWRSWRRVGSREDLIAAFQNLKGLLKNREMSYKGREACEGTRRNFFKQNI